MITHISAAKPEVSQGMLDLADRLEEAAAMIRRGEVRAASVCYVETGPDMNVTTSWSSMSGRMSMIGGLHRMMVDIGLY